MLSPNSQRWINRSKLVRGKHWSDMDVDSWGSAKEEAAFRADTDSGDDGEWTEQRLIQLGETLHRCHDIWVEKSLFCCVQVKWSSGSC